MFKKTILVSATLAALLFSCKQKGEEREIKAYQTNGDTITVISEHLQQKLKIGVVTEEPFVKEVITSGTVQAIPTQFAYIAPPFPGRIIKSYIKLGQQVSAGTPLFEITSPDFTEAQKEYYQALSEKELANKELIRKEDLLKHGVGSKRELEEAQNVLKIVDKEYENAIAVLKIYQTDPKSMVLGQPLVVRSPINGNVIDNNIVTGQFITDDAEPVATVADLNQVWMVAQVKEKDIKYIHAGTTMDIHIAAMPDSNIEGTVFHVDQSVDEETRSIKVLSVCDNKDGLLKLGMYTTVHFLDKPKEQIAIPEKALLQGEKSSYVLVQIADNKFVHTPVEVEATKDGKAIIEKGLQQGQKIIFEGGYYLN